MKNYGKSNRDKLLNLARQTKGADYNLLLLRFVQERFLYRLSQSPYRDHFFLKGGALLYAHERFAARPTRDMDFLGDRIDRDKENLKRIIIEVCQIECVEDGVTSRMKDFFDVYNILKSEKINKEVLNEAIREVFANRGTQYQQDHPLFAEAFAKNEIRHKQWKAYLKKIKYKEDLPFEMVMSKISELLQPIWNSLA